MRNYGYRDPELVTNEARAWTLGKWLALIAAILLIGLAWFALTQKLLLGSDWISETYDNEDWRTNEGNLHTYGAWDLEAHVWKTEYAMEWWPNVHWTPFWYLGMPLFKYYQQGFYLMNWLVMLMTGTSAPRAALLLIVVSHLAAVLLTFLLCYKVSRRIWVSALSSLFLLTNTFISLRSYGWEPITVVFLFLFPLGLLLFLRDPLRPLRFWMIIVLGIAYLCHPLLWFSLCMFMGLYLLAIAVRNKDDHEAATRHYILQYVVLVVLSILVGAVQFFPQVSYEQATSGAHMGVKYLPFYQVPPNIISLKDFFLDMGNLKGPGPIILIAFFSFIAFAIIEWKMHKAGKKGKGKQIHQHELIMGALFVLIMMIVFYYLEMYNLFPMNLLRSIQYHRIIPEFIITAALLVAALSNVAQVKWQKVLYYTMLITFALASCVIIYKVQAYWQTTEDISQRPEFLYEPIDGRISFPFSDQSLSVRNSFTNVPQSYGYYEQGITNAYNDEIFSVSSGYHNANLTLVYLKAANVGRLYVNMEEGDRDAIVRTRLNNSPDFPFTWKKDERYAYFKIALYDPSFAQAVDGNALAAVKAIEPQCRELFKETYCGSYGEEFVSTDPTESAYLDAYVRALEAPYAPKATMVMLDPQHYKISVRGADANTAIVVKMTYDADFTADIAGQPVGVSTIGPDFIQISPKRAGDYDVLLVYHVDEAVVAGAWTSVITVVLLILLFLFTPWRRFKGPRLKDGDL